MAKKTKSLEFRNHYLLLMGQWLDIPLQGHDARIKAKFFRLISDAIQDIITERSAKLERYEAEKDEKGNWKTDIEGYVFKDSKKGKHCMKEIMELMDEIFILDVLPSNEQLLKEIGEMFINLERKFDTNEGVQYDYICTEFEKI